MKKLRSLSIVLAALILMLTGLTFAGVIKAKAAGPRESAAIVMADEAGSVSAVAAAAESSATGSKAIAAAIAIGLAAVSGTMAMGIAIAKSNEGVARQPEAAGKIQTQLMLGLVFIETVVIYALIVEILIVFVL